MSRQRWGTFSVRDHVGPQPFAADVLMYDRLVLPHPVDAKERDHWHTEGWEPDRLDKILEVLRISGDENKRHAITVPWNDYSKDLFKQRVGTAGIVNSEANYQWTRRLLAEDLRPVASPGVTAVEVLAAYQSVDTVQEEWIENDDQKHREILTAVIAYEFLVPDPKGKTDFELLKEAVDLADSGEFQQKRAQIYKWRDDIIQTGISNANAVKEMAQYIEEYNAATKKAIRDVYKKFAFTLVPVGITALAGPFAPAAGLGAIANLIRFWIFDRKPVVKAGDSQVAAMLHTVKQELGWRVARAEA